MGKKTQKWSTNDPKMMPKRCQNGPKMMPKGYQKDSQMTLKITLNLPKMVLNHPKMTPFWSQDRPQRQHAGVFQVASKTVKVVHLMHSIASLSPGLRHRIRIWVTETTYSFFFCEIHVFFACFSAPSDFLQYKKNILFFFRKIAIKMMFPGF